MNTQVWGFVAGVLFHTVLAWMLWSSGKKKRGLWEYFSRFRYMLVAGKIMDVAMFGAWQIGLLEWGLFKIYTPPAGVTELFDKLETIEGSMFWIAFFMGVAIDSISKMVANWYRTKFVNTEE